MTPVRILASDREDPHCLGRRQARCCGLGEATDPRRRVWPGCGENRETTWRSLMRVFINIGTYPGEAAARADDVVEYLCAARAVGAYDAAVVTNDDAGKVHVNKDEMATRHGRVGRRRGRRCRRHLVPAGDHRHPPWAAQRWAGWAANCWRGMSRSDVQEFGELIVWLTPPVADRRPTEGEAALWARNLTLPIWGRLTISSS